MELEKYYKDLASYYSFHLARRLKLSKGLLSARLGITGLILELKQFVNKKGQSNKASDRMEMYNHIMDTLDEADRLETENYTLVQIANSALREQSKLKDKVRELEDRIKEIERFYN